MLVLLTIGIGIKRISINERNIERVPSWCQVIRTQVGCLRSGNNCIPSCSGSGSGSGSYSGSGSGCCSSSDSSHCSKESASGISLSSGSGDGDGDGDDDNCVEVG